MKTVKIKPYDNFEIYFNLKLYETTKQMQKAIVKNDPDYKLTGKEAGLFCHNVFVTHDKYEGEFRSNYLGEMFLNFEDLEHNSDVVVHEIGHCAFSFFHYVLRYSGNFKDEDNHGEYYFYGTGKVYEAFCYFQQIVYKKVWQAIKQYKRELK